MGRLEELVEERADLTQHQPAARRLHLLLERRAREEQVLGLLVPLDPVPVDPNRLLSDLVPVDHPVDGARVNLESPGGFAR